jgi:putative endopeptidase
MPLSIFHLRAKALASSICAVLCLGTMTFSWAEDAVVSEISKSNFDLSTAACTDFYTHANGGWLDQNPLPSDETSWGSFDVLEARGQVALRVILDEAVNTTTTNSLQKKLVGNFYRAAMDEDRIEALGVKPLAENFARIDALQSPESIAAYIGDEQKRSGVLFGLFANGDFNNPNMQIAYATQGGLTLPERDYYLKSDLESQKLLSQYQAHVAMMFVLSGRSAVDANTAAAQVLAFETRLAKASFGRVELRNPDNRYRSVSVTQANKETPNFDWAKLFAKLNVKVENFSLASPQFFAEMDKMLVDTDPAIWREYFRWGELHAAAGLLSKDLAEEDFAFFGRTLRGAKQRQPRWKRMVDMTSASLGQPLGKLYVEKHFPPAAKAQALALINDLKTALKVRLEKLPWMSTATRKEALAKFATFTPKIGYPDKWRDYSSLDVRRDDLFGNVQRISMFERDFNLRKIGQPIDRSEWSMSPQTVNAYYSAQRNEIVFPAAILQPPFFDPKADRALNYGGIGAVIGHELLHGFDDQGSKFDAKGAKRDWWNKSDREKFEARTAKLDQQASATKVGDLNINGQLTMGENIADLGGVTVAFDALQLALKRAPQSAIDGYSAEQRFFLSWAQIWRRNVAPQSLKLQLNTGPHAPSVFRVNGPLANIPSFAEAFSCKTGDPMVRPEASRVVIW